MTNLRAVHAEWLLRKLLGRLEAVRLALRAPPEGVAGCSRRYVFAVSNRPVSFMPLDWATRSIVRVILWMLRTLPIRLRICPSLCHGLEAFLERENSLGEDLGLGKRSEIADTGEDLGLEARIIVRQEFLSKSRTLATGTSSMKPRVAA